MDNLLDTQQVKCILNVSYPTALGFMKEHGSYTEEGSPSGKWWVDADKVRQMLIDEANVTAAKITRLNEALADIHHPA